jgi:hypothetical protein
MKKRKFNLYIKSFKAKIQKIFTCASGKKFKKSKMNLIKILKF